MLSSVVVIQRYSGRQGEGIMRGILVLLVTTLHTQYYTADIVDHREAKENNDNNDNANGNEIVTGEDIDKQKNNEAINDIIKCTNNNLNKSDNMVDNTDNFTSNDETELISNTSVSLMVLLPLLSLLTLCGILSILSNSLVIMANNKHSRRIFDRPILSLAWVDILTGVISTPIVCTIYYYKCKC